MKRISIFLIVCLLASTPALRAQDAAAAAAKADRDAAEERYKRLNSAVDDLLAAQRDQQLRIAALAQEIQSLREQSSKPTGNYASQDELRKLAETVQTIDRKRIEDNEHIVKEFEKLVKAVTAGGSGSSGKKSSRSAASSTDNSNTGGGSTGGASDKGFEHTVAAGDYVSTIAKAYQEKGIKVTVEQILKANPKLDPNKMRIGQKIWIPAPEK